MKIRPLWSAKILPPTMSVPIGEVTNVFWYVLAMILVLAVAVAVVGVVAIGLEGRGKDRVAPNVARQLERLGRHLSGAAEQPPKQFSKLFH